MEKNATVEENINALKWTREAGLGTIIQLVLGMPGESDETIRETIEFLKKVSPHQTWWEGSAPSELISINYAQALPGTPLYEYARGRGFVGERGRREIFAESAIPTRTARPFHQLHRAADAQSADVAALDPGRTGSHYLRSRRADSQLSLFCLLAYYAKLVRVRIEKGWGSGSTLASWADGCCRGPGRPRPPPRQAPPGRTRAMTTSAILAISIFTRDSSSHRC